MHMYFIFQLHLNLQSLSSELTQSFTSESNTEQLLLSIKPSYPIFGSPDHISEFVIATLFETLQKCIKTSNSLRTWHSTFRYIIIIVIIIVVVVVISYMYCYH